MKQAPVDCPLDHRVRRTHPADLLRYERGIRNSGTYHPKGTIRGLVVCAKTGRMILYTHEGEAVEHHPDPEAPEEWEDDDE